MPKVKVVNINKTIKTEGLKSLLEVLAENDIYIAAPCGGSGSCGKCLVRINNERVIKKACQIPVDKDMTVEVLDSKPSEEKILVKGTITELDINPKFEKIVLKPGELSYTSGNLADVIERKYGEPLIFSYLTYKQISEVYPQNFEEITVTVENESGEVLAVESGDTSSHIYGVAIDLGTTTVTGYLWDLSNGERLVSSSIFNKQSPYGADVVSRINYVLENENGTEILQELAISTVNDIVNDLCAEGGINKNNIYQLTLVGNTTMNHLFWGFNPSSLGKAPYLPVTQNSVRAKAKKQSIEINPGGRLSFLPNIAGFLGSDTIACVLAAQLDENKKELLVDLGTNGEIVISGNGRMLACSTAAGPALEGAKISQGMQAVEGAISRVKYKDGEILFSTIGKTEPIGICGSGLIEITALMVDEGVIDKTGRILPPEQIEDPNLAERVIEVSESGKKFTAVPPEKSADNNGIYITQKDIREIQLAKGAIAAGIKELINRAGISLEELESVYLAGAFDNYVDAKSAKSIGLLPQVNEEKIIPMGNAAAAGCQMALINRDIEKRAKDIIDKIDHVELAASSDFQTSFMESMYFG